MPRRPTGNTVRHGGKWYARIAIAPKKRVAVHIAVCGPGDEKLARERTSLMADIAARLRRAHCDVFIETALKNLATLSGPRLDAFVRLARGYAEGTEQWLVPQASDERVRT